MDNRSVSTPLFPSVRSGSQTVTRDSSSSEAFSADWLQNASFPDELLSNAAPQQATSTQVAQSFEELPSDLTEDRLEEGVSVSRRKKVKKEKTVRLPSLEPREDEGIYEQLSRKTFIEETGLAPERAYRVDPKPDVENLSYPSLYKQHVARYPTRLVVMGDNLNPSTLFTNEDNNKKKKHRKQRYFSGKAVSVLYDGEGIVRLTPKICPTQGSEGSQCMLLDYISVNQDDRIQVAKDVVNPLGVYDASTSRYIQGFGPVVPDKGDDSILQFASTEKREFYERTLTFNKQLREDPTNVSLWLKFADFQDEIVQSDIQSQGRHAKRSEIKELESAHSERKLAILERALKDNPRSVELAIARLTVAHRLWEPEKVLSEWKQLAFHHPNSIAMWKHYIMYVQSHLMYFTVPKTVKLFTKCIDMLSKILEGTFVSHCPPPDLEEGMLDIFFIYCSFLEQAGYAERSVASVQALVEFNLFAPSVLTRDMPPDKWKSYFEPFWDSGVPRFGEEGAQGWAHVMVQKKIDPPSVTGFQDLNLKEDEIISMELTRAESWMQFEQLREQYHWLPWRPNILSGESADDCEDPERMVLVDDVLAILFRLQSEDAKYLLIRKILDFFGLRCHSLPHVSCENFVHHSVALIDDQLMAEFNEEVSFMRCNHKSNTHRLPNKKEWQKLEDFVTHALEQAIPLFSGKHKEKLKRFLMRSYSKLAWKYRQDGKLSKHDFKIARKKCKDLLKETENRNLLPLWEEYGRFEWTAGSHSEASKVFERVILASTSETPENNYNLPSNLFSITRCYIELLLCITSSGKCSEQDKLCALYILCCVGSGEKTGSLDHESVKTVPTTALLKAKNFYKNLPLKVSSDLENLVVSGNVPNSELCDHMVNVTALSAVFAYLCNGMTSAKETCESVLKKLTDLIRTKTWSQGVLRSLNETREQLFDVYVNITIFNMSQNIVPRAKLREVLTSALESFPDNPRFLRILLNLEGRSQIAGRLRRFFSKTTLLVSENPIIWMYAIYAEIEHQLAVLRCLEMDESLLLQGAYAPTVSESGITSRIRALFEKAVSSAGSGHCVALWRMFVQFEVLQNDRRRAKNIFYRAIQNCPWAKVLYLDGIRHFPEDLQEILDAMTEKELRLRTPVEEIDLLLENYKKAHGTVLEHEDDSRGPESSEAPKPNDPKTNERGQDSEIIGSPQHDLNASINDEFSANQD